MVTIGYTIMGEQAGPRQLVADAMMAVQSDAELGRRFDAAGGRGNPRIGQVAVSYDPDVDAHVAAVRRFVDAGLTHVALVQVGGDVQDPFLDWSQRELLPALRRL